ncbi:MAG: ABC transporter permease [Verrucomicrobia bacterium]|nr:ABC transporter permease [Verrucomicrobiota bacterium]
MSRLLSNLRVALRHWRRHPAVALIIVLSLAAGIGANATLFAWIDGVILRPLAGTDPAREILAFEQRAPDGSYLATSWLDYRDFRARARLSELGAATGRLLVLRDPRAGAGERAQIWGELVSPNYFEVMGLQPLLGRFFAGEERTDRPGGAPVAVLSARLWRSQFSSDPGIVGRTLEFNRQPLTVIGVAPDDFRGSVPGLGFEVFLPLSMVGPVAGGETGLNFEDRKTRWLTLFAAPRAGTSAEEASAEVAAIGQQLAGEFPRTNAGLSARLLPYWRLPFGPRALLGPLFVILQAASVLLLAVVCANVANLLLALGAARQREFALRLALGAPGRRVVGQLLGEFALLAALGALGGMLLARWLTDLLQYFQPTTRLPLELGASMGLGTLLVAAGLAGFTVLAAGLLPAWQARRADPLTALKDGAGTPRHALLRQAFVVAQVALALVALVGAGLFQRSFAAARGFDPGFQPEGTVVARLIPSAAGYDAAGAVALLDRLRARLEATPGIVRASISDFVPLGLGGASWEDVSIPGYVPAADENLKVWRNAVSPGHLQTLGYRLQAGRDFAEADNASARPVALVNEAFARKYFAGRDPLGQVFTGWGREIAVVGVVNDAKVFALNEPARPFFWVPSAQFYRPQNQTWVQVRTTPGLADSAGLAILRRELHALDPALPVVEALPLREYIAASSFQFRVAAVLLSYLGGLTLLLAALGIYGIVSHGVAQRTREVGIRMALGAQALEVVRLVLAQGFRLVALGLGLGLLLAAGAGQALRNTLLSVGPLDPVVFGGMAVLLALVALGATLLPARRATRIDPVEALRHD